MATEWYFQIMGSVEGPISEGQFHSKVQDGDITPETLVRNGADGEWVLADHVPNLFDANGVPIPRTKKPEGKGRPGKSAAASAQAAVPEQVAGNKSQSGLIIGVLAVAAVAIVVVAVVAMSRSGKADPNPQPGPSAAVPGANVPPDFEPTPETAAAHVNHEKTDAPRASSTGENETPAGTNDGAEKPSPPDGQNKDGQNKTE
jgi:hypothetical protein